VLERQLIERLFQHRHVALGHLPGVEQGAHARFARRRLSLGAVEHDRRRAQLPPRERFREVRDVGDRPAARRAHQQVTRARITQQHVRLPRQLGPPLADAGQLGEERR
jgi:hypothetical protein